MNKFEPLNTTNPLYQIDGSKFVFVGFGHSWLNINDGFVQSSMTRYLLTSNIIQYELEARNPIVLDYGCGSATFKCFWDVNYSVDHKKSLGYIGLEVTKEYVDTGNSKGNLILPFDANNQDVRDLELPSRVDVVLMQQFIEHIDVKSFDYLLDYTYETLDKNGILIISAPNPKYGSKIFEHHHDHEYTLDEIKKILEVKKFFIKKEYGWLGAGIPDVKQLSEHELEIYKRLQYVSKGYADAVMCLINNQFAPYYYLVLKKYD